MPASIHRWKPPTRSLGQGPSDGIVPDISLETQVSVSPQPLPRFPRMTARAPRFMIALHDRTEPIGAMATPSGGEPKAVFYTRFRDVIDAFDE